MVKLPVLLKKLARDIKASRWQFISIVLLVVVGMIFFVGLYSSFQNLRRPVERAQVGELEHEVLPSDALKLDDGPGLVSAPGQGDNPAGTERLMAHSGPDAQLRHILGFILIRRHGIVEERLPPRGPPAGLAPLLHAGYPLRSAIGTGGSGFVFSHDGKIDLVQEP